MTTGRGLALHLGRGSVKRKPATVTCVTCRKVRAELQPVDPEEAITERLVEAALVKAGWRRVVGGWRCPSCIKKEKA